MKDLIDNIDAIRYRMDSDAIEEKDAKKRCKEIQIPFKAGFETSMRSGVKDRTCRTKKYGNEGDTFTAFGMEFIITEIFRIMLREVANNHYHSEGCSSPAHFRRVWAGLHPRRGWEPERMVWMHVFKRIR